MRKIKFLLFMSIAVLTLTGCNENNTGGGETPNNKQPEKIACNFTGQLVPGAEFVEGQYTYRYMQEFNGSENQWMEIEHEGWGVTLTNKNSTEAVNTKLCSKLGGKPVVSMADMFYKSQSTSVDVSSFDTSNVVNMANMFAESKFTTLNLSNFNTSRVDCMSSMFFSSAATSINLSGWDTTNATNMGAMFFGVNLENLDLSSFNTSKLNQSWMMFFNSNIKNLNLINLDTSNITDMVDMFTNSQIENINVKDSATANKLIRDGNASREINFIY